MKLIIDILFGWTGYHLFKQKKTGIAVLWLLTIGCCSIGWFYLIIKDCIELSRAKKPELVSSVKLSPTYSSDIIAELAKIDAMEGHDFEYYCAGLLKANGFTDVTVTQGSGDYGIDVLASKDGVSYAIQCKCYSSPVGNKAVQEAYSGKSYYNKMVAVVMTNNSFTSAAKETAEKNSVLLWDRDKLTDLLKAVTYETSIRN